MPRTAPTLLILLTACAAELAEPCAPVTFDASACDPDLTSFTLDSTNPYYPLVVGSEVVLEGEADGVAMRVERTVLDETRTVAGVEVHVLKHVTYHDGEVHEVANNFYVESVEGVVCYFGEDVEYYEGGALVDTHGTWRVGVDGAKPGVIMPADPQVGDTYYQELAPGSAEDMGQVTARGETVELQGVTWEDVLTIEDTNPIDDEEACSPERKLYAPGVGEIGDVELGAVSWTGG